MVGLAFDYFLGLLLLGVRGLVRILSSMSGCGGSDKSSCSGNEGKKQCRLSRVLEKHQLAEAFPFLKARSMHDVEGLPLLTDEDFAAMREAGH